MAKLYPAVCIISGAFALAGCDNQQPFSFGSSPPDPTTSDPNPVDSSDSIPAVLAGDLATVSYNAGSGLLQVDMNSLDSGSLDSQDMVRRADLDEGVYQAYAYQDDPLDRFFLSYAAQLPDNSVQAAIVVDGGQFTKYFEGGYFSNDTSAYTQPTSGLVSYAGDYIGITNLDAISPTVIAAPPAGTDNSLAPGEPIIVTGEIFLNVDFGDLAINGSIFNRQLEELDGDTFPAFPLEDVLLLPGAITVDGTFEGVVGDITNTQIGNYGGIFGGSDASGVAGTLYLDQGFTDDFESEEERGLFVLINCNQGGASSLCP